jgi:hypothetical protein
MEIGGLDYARTCKFLFIVIFAKVERCRENSDLVIRSIDKEILPLHCSVKLRLLSTRETFDESDICDNLSRINYNIFQSVLNKDF